MTAKEKKLIALGAGAGILAAALVVAILAARELPIFASGAATAARALPAASPADAGQPAHHGAIEPIGDFRGGRAGF
jgi:hypothetical protein